MNKLLESVPTIVNKNEKITACYQLVQIKECFLICNKRVGLITRLWIDIN